MAKTNYYFYRDSVSESVIVIFVFDTDSEIEIPNIDFVLIHQTRGIPFEQADGCFGPLRLQRPPESLAPRGVALRGRAPQ